MVWFGGLGVVWEWFGVGQETLGDVKGCEEDCFEHSVDSQGLHMP